MKRLSMDALEALAFENPGSQIEQASDADVAVLELGRETYYAVTTSVGAK